jgi:hypothetical protein
VSTAKGTFDKAKQIAFRNAEMSLNVLKCFLHEYSIYNQFKIPDLNYRQSHRHWASVLHGKDSSSFNLEALAFNDQEVATILIDEKKIDEFKREKLDEFCHFLSHPKDTEFHRTVTAAIESYAKYVSTTNWHEKVVKLISFFELVLLDARTKPGKGESAMKKQLMPRLFGSSPNCALGIELTGIFYRVRDDYVHHSIERPIIARKLYEFQIIGFRFLRWLVDLNKKIDTLDAFYDLLKQP